MSAENTKQHFAGICECIWNKIQGEEKLDRKTAAAMRNFVVNFSMVAWNACCMQKSFADVKAFLKKFAEENFDGDQCVLLPLLDAAELKWRKYRDDKNIIANAEVKTVNGLPQVIAYLKDESPEISSAFKPFYDLMNSPEIQERLKNTPPEKLNEEIGKIVAEYNASLPPPVPFTVDDEDDDDDDEDFKTDYMPISPEDLEWYSADYEISSRYRHWMKQHPSMVTPDIALLGNQKFTLRRKGRFVSNGRYLIKAQICDKRHKDENEVILEEKVLDYGGMVGLKYAQISLFRKVNELLEGTSYDKISWKRYNGESDNAESICYMKKVDENHYVIGRIEKLKGFGR